MDGAKRRAADLGVEFEQITESVLRNYTPEEKKEIERIEKEITALKGRARANITEIENSKAEYKATAAFAEYKEIKEKATGGKKGIAPTVLEAGKIEKVETQLTKFESDITSAKLVANRQILDKEKDKKHTEALLRARRIEEYLDHIVELRKAGTKKAAEAASSKSHTEPEDTVVEIHSVPAGGEAQPAAIGEEEDPPTPERPISPILSASPTHPKYKVLPKGRGVGLEEEVEEEVRNEPVDEVQEEGKDILPNPLFPPKVPNPPQPLDIPNPQVVPNPQEVVSPVLTAEQKERKEQIFRERVLRQEFLREITHKRPGLEDQGRRISELSGDYFANGLTREDFNTLREYWVKYTTELEAYVRIGNRLTVSELQLRIPEEERTQTELETVIEPNWEILNNLIEEPKEPEELTKPKEPEELTKPKEPEELTKPKDSDNSDTDEELTDEEIARMADTKMRKALSQVMGSVTKYGGSTGDDPNGHLQCFKIHFRIVTGVDIMLPLTTENDKKWAPEIIDSFECTLYSHARHWFRQYTTLTRAQKTPDKWDEIRKAFVKKFSLYGSTDVEKEIKLGDIVWDYTKVSFQDFLLHFRTLMGVGDEEVPAPRQLSLFIKAMPAKIFNQYLINVTNLDGAIDAVTKVISLGCVDLEQLKESALKDSAASVGSKNGGSKAAVPFMSATSVPQAEAKGLKKSMQSLEQSLMQKIEDVMFVGAAGQQINQNQKPWRGKGRGRGQGRGGGYQGGQSDQSGGQPGNQNQQQGGGYWNNPNPGWDNSGQNWNNPSQNWGWGSQGQSWGGQGQGWGNQSQGWGGQQGGGWGGKKRGGGGWRGPPRGRGRGGPSGGPPTNPGMDLSKVKCYNCGKMGHLARFCRSRDGVDGSNPPQQYGGQGNNQPKASPAGGGINAKDLAQVIKDLVKDKNGSLN